MTVCIVATCEISAPLAPKKGIMPQWLVPGIVAVSDRMLSTEAGSIQPDQPKSFAFGISIRCWFAGDPGNCEDIVDSARALLPPTPTVRQVATAVDGAFVAETRRRGRIARREDPSIRINSYRLGLQLLVAGVDAAGSHIYEIDDNLRAHRADTVGFSAIGSGAFLATDYLNRINLRRLSPMPEALFGIYVAKRMAEASPTVGGKTHISIIRQSNEIWWSPILVGDLDKGYRQLVAAESRKRDGVVRSLSQVFARDPRRYVHEIDRA